MKTDRLIALTTYLLNREIVSAAALAERFEVSKRTIQRDIEILNQAGIPIISTYGINGGYEITDGFRLAKQLAAPEDFINIITALEGYTTAFKDNSVRTTLEKSLTLLPDRKQHIFLNLSSSREGLHTDDYLYSFDRAITDRVPLTIRYIDSSQTETERIVEPLALTYQWYSWYLFAYCRTRADYRLFKLARIIGLEAVPNSFTINHTEVSKLLKATLESDKRVYHTVRLLCRKEIVMQVQEYFKNGEITELDNGDIILKLHVPFERMWFSLLLGFGNKVQVLEPEEIKMELLKKAYEIIELYK